MPAAAVRSTSESMSVARISPDWPLSRSTIAADQASCPVEQAQLQTRNLLAPRGHGGERFDAIFCRNVAIYFNEETQQDLLEVLTGALVPGGMLFVGQSEMFPLGHPRLRSCGQTAYQRVPG